MNVVVNDFFSSAVFEVVSPGGINFDRLGVVMEKGVALHAVVGAHVDVETAGNESQHYHNDGVNARCDNETLAQFDVPNRFTKIIGKSNTFFLAEYL